MEFSGDAIVLGARGHGETGAIVHVLTADHGVFAAHIAGGASRRMKAALQPGARVVFTYRARHSDQLGSATLEVDGPTPDVLDDPLALIGLQCACAMTPMPRPVRLLSGSSASTRIWQSSPIQAIPGAAVATVRAP